MRLFHFKTWLQRRRAEMVLVNAARDRVLSKNSDFDHYDDRILRWSYYYRAAIDALMCSVWLAAAAGLIEIGTYFDEEWEGVCLYLCSIPPIAMACARAVVAFRILLMAPFMRYDWLAVEEMLKTAERVHSAYKR